MNKTLIDIRNVAFTYKMNSEEGQQTKAVVDVCINIKQGEFLVILGRNGSGKSTLAKLMNALITPSAGTILVDGIDTRNEKLIWNIRSTVGMVFQNPDNQIIGTTVEEDTAFGPENLGVKPSDIRKRVDYCLKNVGMLEYSERAPHLLSGGQKQRVAIAGILAMQPKCIVLDEATSMLDPKGRQEVMTILRRLNKKDGITVIHITHHMEETVEADRILVVDEGRIVREGTPHEVLCQVDYMKSLGLAVPQVTELFYNLRKKGYNVPDNIITVEEAVEFFKSRI